MTGVEIGLLIAGAAFIVVGNMFAENRKGNNGLGANEREIWSDKDEVTIKDRVNIVLSDKSEQIINETDDKLCHISNEKIMEFQEFADQLLEKLNENHNQTVFMYKMLTDKQDEMKEWITNIDTMYSLVKNEINDYKNTLPDVTEQIEVIEKHEKKETEKKTVESKNDKEPEMPNVIQESVSGKTKQKNIEKNDQSDKSKFANVKSVGVSNKNEKILELYDSGKTIVEVSKMLGIGQGEVKLVVGLYRGKK